MSMGDSRVLATIGVGPHARLLESSSQTFRRYAMRHGYDYVEGSGVMNEPRPLAWAKIPLLRRLVESYDIVLWIDADAVFLDDTVDVAVDLRPETWQALVAHDLGDGIQVFPNTGVWVLRGGERSARFLEAIWESRGLIDAPFWENSAAMSLLGFTTEHPVVQVDPDSSWLIGTQWLGEEWNSLTVYSHRLTPARIRHLAGEPFGRRDRQIRADVAAANGARVRPWLQQAEYAIARRPWRHPWRLAQNLGGRALATVFGPRK